MTRTRLALAMAGIVAWVAPAQGQGWNEPQAPFALYGNSYYVGTRGISAVLVTSPVGHILIDGATPEAALQIAANVRTLGFRPEDIRYILSSHAHIDHAGGISSLQRLSGAEALAGAAAVPVLLSGEAGKSDPQFGNLPKMPPVARARALRDGDVVTLGPLVVTMHATPGHTPGGASWTWESREHGKTMRMVYADSLTAVAAKDFRYSGDPAYPTARADIERSIAKVAALPCDILVSAHPEAGGLWGRHERRAEMGHAAYVDAGACRSYAVKAQAWLDKTLAAEAATTP